MLDLSLEDWLQLKEDLRAGIVPPEYRLELLRESGTRVPPGSLRLLEFQSLVVPELGADTSLPGEDRLEAYQLAIATAEDAGRYGSLFMFSVLLSARLRFDGGDVEGALDVLLRASDSVPPEDAFRPTYLLEASRYARRGDRLELAGTFLEQALPLTRAQGPESKAWLDQLLYTAELDHELGLADRVGEPILEAVRGLELLYSRGQPVRGNLRNAWVLRARWRLAIDDFETLVEEVDEVDPIRRELLDEYPETAASLEYIAGMAYDMLAVLEPELASEAEERFRRVRESPAAYEIDRLGATQRLGRLALRAREWEQAARWIEDARRRLDDLGAPPILERSFQRGLEAVLDLGRGRPAEQLRTHLPLLEDVGEAMLDFIYSPPYRSGGIATLDFESHRYCFGARIQLEVHLDPDAGAGRALEVVLAQQARSSLTRALGARTVSVAQLQTSLLPGEGFVLHFPMDEGSHVFALDRQGVVYERTLSDRRVRRLILDWRKALLQASAGGRRGPEDTAALHQLGVKVSEAVFPPAIRERMAAWETVLITGRDFLEEAPLECLPTRPPRTLGLDYALGYVPSVHLYVHWAERHAGVLQRTYDGDLRLLASPEVDRADLEAWGGLAQLQLRPEQLEALLDPFDPARVDVLLGSQASLASLRSRPGSTRILEFLVHGVRRPDAERDLALLLSADGEHPDGLFSSEHAESAPAPPLVVLGACASASGALRPGEGEGATMGSAFLRAGAIAVVGTSADVSLEPLQLLLARFHRNLREGASAAEALRAARVDLFEAGWEHPCDHSLVHVTGLPSRALFARHETAAPGNWTLYLALSMGALAIGALAVVRRARA